MTSASLYLDLLAYSFEGSHPERLEARLVRFLEADRFTEPLDGKAFAQVNGAQSKADYLLANRAIVAELKTINTDPQSRMEIRLKERFAKPDAPIVFGTLGISKVIEKLDDRDEISKKLIDMAGRAVRRHLKKANDQIAAIKDRLDLPNAGGLVILMNDVDQMTDISAIGYSIKSALETVDGGYPHITNIWVIVESHRIAMQSNRVGYPQLHVFRSLERQAEMAYLGRMLEAWGVFNGSRVERIMHKGNWDSMRPIYDGPTPTLGL